MILIAADYNSRPDIEAVVLAEIGTDINENMKSVHRISGSRDDLIKLHLTDLTTVYGVRCTVTDTPTKDIVKKI